MSLLESDIGGLKFFFNEIRCPIEFQGSSVVFHKTYECLGGFRKRNKIDGIRVAQCKVNEKKLTRHIVTLYETLEPALAKLFCKIVYGPCFKSVQNTYVL